MRALAILLLVPLLGCNREPAAPQAGSAALKKPRRAAPICPSPALDSIPDAPIRGEANGAPFEARAVYFERGPTAWQLVIHESALSSSTAVAPRGQHLLVILPEAPSSGMSRTRPMRFGEGYFEVRRPGAPSATTSWNAENSWAIEVTAWDARPFDPAASLPQEAGRASGRVAVCYRGGGAFKDSWVAGAFKDAVLRYSSKPAR